MGGGGLEQNPTFVESCGKPPLSGEAGPYPPSQVRQQIFRDFRDFSGIYRLYYE